MMLYNRTFNTFTFTLFLPFHPSHRRDIRYSSPLHKWRQNCRLWSPWLWRGPPRRGGRIIAVPSGGHLVCPPCLGGECCTWSCSSWSHSWDRGWWSLLRGESNRTSSFSRNQFQAFNDYPAFIAYNNNNIMLSTQTWMNLKAPSILG